MREIIKNAYDKYVALHKVKPDFISLNSEDFHKIIGESFNDSDQPFWGMHALVISDTPSSFGFFHKRDLDEVLVEFEQKNEVGRNYRTSGFNSIEIIGRNPNANSKLPVSNMDTSVEISDKVVRAYKRHLDMLKQGKVDSY